MLLATRTPVTWSYGTLEQHPDHLGGGRRVVGVVPVDHQVDVGVEVGHRTADDVSLASQGFVPNLRACGLGHFRGAIGAAVVVDVDLDLGERPLQVDDNPCDGGLLVVTRDDRGDPHGQGKLGVQGA